MYIRITFLFINLLLTPIASGEPKVEKSERFTLVGSISQNSGKKNVGIVLIKDSVSTRTIPVQIGKVFAVGKEVFRVVSVENGAALISSGRDLMKVGASENTASFGAPQRKINAPGNETFKLTNKPADEFQKSEGISPERKGLSQEQFDRKMAEQEAWLQKRERESADRGLTDEKARIRAEEARSVEDPQEVVDDIDANAFDEYDSIANDSPDYFANDGDGTPD